MTHIFVKIDKAILIFLASIKLTKILKATSDVTKSMNSLMNIKELNQTMGDMQKEMMKVIWYLKKKEFL